MRNFRVYIHLRLIRNIVFYSSFLINRNRPFSTAHISGIEKNRETSNQVDYSQKRGCKILKEINIPQSCHGNLFELVWSVTDGASIFETDKMIAFGA